MNRRLSTKELLAFTAAFTLVAIFFSMLAVALISWGVLTFLANIFRG